MDFLLFLVHIGPVQTFIASARRTRDLYYGSRLLSELAKVVAHTIATVHSSDNLIFPAPSTIEDLVQGGDLDVANKVLACIPFAPTAAHDLGKQINKDIKDYLAERRKKLKEAVEESAQKVRDQAARTKDEDRGQLADKVRKELSWETIDNQLADMTECFWAAIPFDKDKDRYDIKRKELEGTMAARKNTRIFQHVSWGDEQAKSSIDGQLEGILPQQLYPAKETNQRMRRRTEQDETRTQRNSYLLYELFRAGPAERLSSIDLLKRRGTFPSPPFQSQNNKQQAITFPSTSHIAALPYLEALEKLPEDAQKVLRKKWSTYIEKAKSLGIYEAQAVERIQGFREHKILDMYDGGMLFSERLLQDTVYTTRLQPAQTALDDFFKAVDEYFVHTIRPTPYYAILIADGDSMGTVIDHQAKRENGIEQHQELTRKLTSFAKEARKTINEHKGAAIYIGGDDVVAFLPVHTALHCGAALAQGFRELLKDFRNEKGISPTLSMGIAVVHHLEMLQEALEVARSAEKAAKDVDGKNALAITIAKRGGEQYSIAGQWNDLDHYLHLLLPFYVNRAIPKGIAYDIRDTVQRFHGLSALSEKDAAKLAAVIQADIQRILLCRLPAPDSALPAESRDLSSWKEDDKQKQIKVATLYELLQARINIAPSESAHKKKIKNNGKQEQPVETLPIRPLHAPKIDFQAFTNELLVAQTLAEVAQLVATERKVVEA